MYRQTAPQFIQMLNNLSTFIDKAEKYAQAKKFDMSVLLHSRLAPDMFDFIKQVQSACDAAKFCCARLTGKEAPKHEDNEQTLDQIRARIHKCVTYLETFKPEDFKGCEDRPVLLPFFEGKRIKGDDYAAQLGIPNFYFHVTAAYAILRHNGVDVGKKDFLHGIKFMEG